ncbi:MAG: phospho-N-acetylmuramoyl-pentapeptide-transferase [Lachnospiraceae bacterium]|nr:phospho-N-acetylmuramoyl-pentapeptide-transferase [Lachnospiraceae bacterium]
MLTFLFKDCTVMLSVIGVVFAYGLTYLCSVTLDKFMPADQGREFAVNGDKSRGKTRGVGLFFVSVFIFIAVIFGKIDSECAVYLCLIFCGMMTGYLDDAAKTPWGEYKKGILDLIIAILVAVNFLYHNSAVVSLAIFDISFKISIPLYGVLIVILVWASINVTNCTDGVDGLSTTLVLISLTSMLVLGGNGPFLELVPFFMSALLAYLWFNASPSSQLMGDAGSRAMGLVLAITILQTKSPFMFLLFAAVIIVDGGLGLVKVSLKRFLKISIFKNTRMPLHDHARKNLGWSDSQVVFRFAIIQVMISVCGLYLSLIN